MNDRLQLAAGLVALAASGRRLPTITKAALADFDAMRSSSGSSSGSSGRPRPDDLRDQSASDAALAVVARAAPDVAGAPIVIFGEQLPLATAVLRLTATMSELS